MNDTASKHRSRAAFAALALVLSASAHGAITTYSSQSSFEAALDGSFTLVNLDAAPLGLLATPYRLEDAGPTAAFFALNVDFFDYNAEVVSGQNGSTPTDRDRWIRNGTGFGGMIGINFLNGPVDGVGAFSNFIDYGRIRAFSAQNLGGNFLGEVQFGPGSFGGLTSDVPIASVQFTCDFNQDLKCGVYDIQFGTFANAVPEPQSYALLAAGLGLLGFAARLRRPRG